MKRVVSYFYQGSWVRETRDSGAKMASLEETQREGLPTRTPRSPVC